MQAAPTVALRLSLPDAKQAEAEAVKEAVLEEADVGAGQSMTAADLAEAMAMECAADAAWPEYDLGLTSSVPEGTGPLYKCAICDEVVYESSWITMCSSALRQVRFCRVRWTALRRTQPSSCLGSGRRNRARSQSPRAPAGRGGPWRSAAAPSRVSG